MGTMTVSEACYVVFDVLAPALLAKREGHVRKPVSALKGYDLVEIDLALKLVVANEFLLLTGRNDFEKKFAEGVKAYTVPVAGLLLFVADDQVDDYDAKHAFDTYGDPRFLSQETTSVLRRVLQERRLGSPRLLAESLFASRLGIHVNVAKGE